MSDRTLFDEIIDGHIPSWKIWEDDHYLAFLTPFGNTPGAAVVVPKQNPGAYVFDLDDAAIAGLMAAAKKTAKLIQKGLGVERVAAVFEGQEVPHVHVKLFPMHKPTVDHSNFPKQQVFFPAYPGHISTLNGPKMSDAELNEVQDKIRKA